MAEFSEGLGDGDGVCAGKNTWCMIKIPSRFLGSQ